MTITDSINSRHFLAFDYDGLPRVVIPVAYGVTAHGSPVLRAWQISGESKTHNVPGWHLFTVDKMQSIRMLPETFTSPPPDYERGGKDMARVIAQL